MTLPGLRGLSGWRVLKLAGAKYVKDDMSTYAAALAYRMIFALFPFLIFLTTLLGFLHLPQLFEWMREQAVYLLPEYALKQVNSVIDELQTPQGGLMSVGIALALWSASAGVVATMDALNVAYDVRERRAAWKRVAVSVGYTIGLAAMLIAAAALMIVGPEVLGWAARYIRLDTVFLILWTWIRWPVAVFLVMLSVALVYYAAPNIKQPFRFITPGSTLAVIVWITASVAFKIYVQNFAKYNQTYGSLGAGVVLLLYFFLSAAVLLFGAEVNAVVEHESGNPPEECPR